MGVIGPSDMIPPWLRSRGVRFSLFDVFLDLHRDGRGGGRSVGQLCVAADLPVCPPPEQLEGDEGGRDQHEQRRERDGRLHRVGDGAISAEEHALLLLVAAGAALLGAAAPALALALGAEPRLRGGGGPRAVVLVDAELALAAALTLLAALLLVAHRRVLGRGARAATRLLLRRRRLG